MNLRQINRALIIPADCCLGSHLADQLIFHSGREVEVIGIVRRENPRLIHLKHLSDKINFSLAGSTNSRNNPEEIAGFIEKIRPDTIFYIPEPRFEKPASWLVPREIPGPHFMFKDICDGVVRARMGQKIAICAVGSYEQYGEVAEKDLPITEETPPKPVTLYAAVMCDLERLIRDYREDYNLKISSLRVFNYSGPRRETEFADADFALQLAEIKNNERRPFVRVGNLSAIRDFTDARDVARALIASVEYELFDSSFNVCSGRAFSIREILNRLISLAGIQVEIDPDDRRIRLGEPLKIIGSSEKFQKATSWRPAIDYFEQTLPDLWGHYWALVAGRL